jgi:hypothetical protein
VTRLSYSSGALSVFDASTLVAALTFSGSYSSASFSAVSDGHGGTDILDPPGSRWLAVTGGFSGTGRG